MSQLRGVAVVIFFLVVSKGESINLALNKRAFMSADAIQSDSGKTVDGDSASYAVFDYWVMIDLEKDYQIDRVDVEYLSYGGAGWVTVELFASNFEVFPSQYLTPKVCETQYCLAGNTRRTKTFTCLGGPEVRSARFVKVRRHNFDHPYFRVYQVTATGSELETQVSHSWLQQSEGQRMQTTLTPTEFQTTSVLKCSLMCKQLPGCEGVNFNHVTGTCQMLRVSINDTLSNHGDWTLVFFIYL